MLGSVKALLSGELTVSCGDVGGSIFLWQALREENSVAIRRYRYNTEEDDTMRQCQVFNQLWLSTHLHMRHRQPSLNIYRSPSGIPSVTYPSYSICYIHPFGFLLLLPRCISLHGIKPMPPLGLEILSISLLCHFTQAWWIPSWFQLMPGELHVAEYHDRII